MRKNFCFLVFLLINLNLLNLMAVKVSPVRFDANILAGKTMEFTLNLTGTTGLANQELVIYPTDLSMDRHGALAFDSLRVKVSGVLSNRFYGSLSNSAVDWIKIETPRLSLLEKQDRPVKFKVSIPHNATPGEYYAVIMVEPARFQNIKQEKNNPVKLKIKTRVAVIFVLDVPGRVYQKKALIDSTKIVSAGSFIKVLSSLKNDGNVHLDVSSKVTVRQADTKTEMGSFALKATNSSQPQAFIFPGAIRDFEGTLERELPAGHYLAEISYNYGYIKQAKTVRTFSVSRKVPLDESQAQFLSIELNKIDLYLPAKAMRIKLIKLTNLDYRPLTVNVVTEGKVAKVNSGNIIILKPGEVKNVQIAITVPDNQEPIITDAVTFKTDRGKSVVIPVSIKKTKEKNEI